MHKITDQVIIIAGATGTGKTAVACALATVLGGEIISADSRQVYRYLDVGTNKAGQWDEKRNVRVADGVAQHLTDLVNPDMPFSAGDFVRLALERIRLVRSNGKIPIVAGGTGLYIKALVDGLAPLPEKNEAVRSELRAALEKKGTEYLYKQLMAVDPLSADANRHNPQRLIRALEVYRLSGVPMSILHQQTRPPDEHFFQFGLRWDRTRLYALLDRRCSDMIDNGMIAETEQALSKGFSADSPGLQSLGYRDAVRYLKGAISRSEALELLRLDTRHYAKRQTTWFNRDRRIAWLETDGALFNPHAIADKIIQML